MRISVRGDSGGVQVRMHLDRQRWRWLTTRILLAVSAAQGVVIGFWAVVLPHSFYEDFPGLGMHWIAADGPYNHHLTTDVGAFFLALGVVAAAAAYLNTGNAARLAGLGWLVFAVPHFLYHVTHHPTAMPTGSYVLSVIATVLLAILATAVLVIAPRGAQLPDPDPINLRFRRRGTGARPAR